MFVNKHEGEESSGNYADETNGKLASESNEELAGHALYWLHLPLFVVLAVATVGSLLMAGMMIQE